MQLPHIHDHFRQTKLAVFGRNTSEDAAGADRAGGRPPL